MTFLGCNIRKYGDKLLTKPSKQNVKSIMRKIRGTIKKFRTGKQSRSDQMPESYYQRMGELSEV